MDETENHYNRLLGLSTPWSVTRVNLSTKSKRIDIFVDYKASSGPCPECGADCPLHDHSPSRVWRHLDTMQFATYLNCEPPRVCCSEHGTKTLQLPWAQKHSRFTVLFETFAIKVTEASRSVQEATTLLGIGWHQLQAIMTRAVERGLQRRGKEEIAWLGMDEKSFRKGHNYISVVNDLEGGRVLDVAEGRNGTVADELLQKALDKHQREMVCAVAVDMSAPYIGSIRRQLPNADIVHDKFHISQHLNDPVDKTRRKEHRKLAKQSDQRLKGTKFLWLRGMEHLSDEAFEQLQGLANAELEVSKAWHLKELFRHFWTRRDGSFARAFFENWYKQALQTGLSEVNKVARMLKNHLENILTYFESYITNATSEGINSKIQSLKANARGFRSFQNYRTTILFFCGKLNLLP